MIASTLGATAIAIAGILFIVGGVVPSARKLALQVVIVGVILTAAAVVFAPRPATLEQSYVAR